MVSLGTHVVKVGEAAKADSLKLLHRDALISVLVHDAEDSLDDVVRLLLVLDLILRVGVNYVSSKAIESQHTFDFFCEMAW
jgi:hypothetical protein